MAQHDGLRVAARCEDVATDGRARVAPVGYGEQAGGACVEQVAGRERGAGGIDRQRSELKLD